jgi:hypothetical protein
MTLNPIVFALRHPITVMVAIAAVVVGSALAVLRMKVDIFPALNLPVVYVAQPYGGMDPAQMEGLITNYYEYHFLYINGIHHVESKSAQGAALMKLTFHPGTDMAQALAETVGYVNRSRAFMPPGTVPPFIMRFDTGSVPVGYLVLRSDSKSIGEIQDQALFKVRPMFASLPGVSAPPPFGGNQRTVVVTVNPDRLRAYNLSPEEVVKALTTGNTVSPSGNIRVKDRMPIVPADTMVVNPQDLGNIPVRPGSDVYLRDLGAIQDSTDVPTGYALANGKRAVYLLVNKRADASTLAVINEVKKNLPKMQATIPEDIEVRLKFDQSPYVTRAAWGVGTKGLLGALLTSLMVLVFLRDGRSVLVVVLNQPAGGGARGRPLYVVDRTDPVRVFVNVPGADAAWVRDGAPVSLRLQGAGGELFQGKVTRNARSLDPRARTLRTEIDLPNPSGKLLPGTYVLAAITVQHANAWTLPAAAVVTEGDNTFCYRVVDGRAVRTPLQVGLSGGGLVEVLKVQAPAASPGAEGEWREVTGGEEVVASDPAALSDGQPVRAAPEKK